jgi:TPR repeat protein
MLIASTSFAHVASAQGFGAEKHRDEILVPSKAPSLSDRREGQRLFQAAKNYWHGENGYSKDHAKAMELFALAARTDYPPALYYLSQIYFVGEDTPVDVDAGVALLKRAYRLGLHDADARLVELRVICPRDRASMPGEVSVSMPSLVAGYDSCALGAERAATYADPIVTVRVPLPREISVPQLSSRVSF